MSKYSPWGKPRRGARNEQEAHEMLKRARSQLIADGYKIAVELASPDKRVHSQMVLAEMEHRGLLDERHADIPRNWTGLIFRGTDYKDTWEPCGYMKIGDSSRNTHAATRRLWKLKGAPDPKEPKTPSSTEVAAAVTAYRDALRIALQSGYKIQDPQAMKRVGLWLRHLSGEDVQAEIESDSEE